MYSTNPYVFPSLLLFIPLPSLKLIVEPKPRTWDPYGYVEIPSIGDPYAETTETSASAQTSSVHVEMEWTQTKASTKPPRHRFLPSLSMVLVLFD